MAKIQLNKILLFILIIAFLTMQWSTGHIHLATHHNHNGSQHQHKLSLHAYQPVSHHNAAHSAHYQESDKVIVLEHECNTPAEKKLDDHPATTIAVFYRLASYVKIHHAKVVRDRVSPSQYSISSSIQARAPPQQAV